MRPTSTRRFTERSNASRFRAPTWVSGVGLTSLATSAICQVWWMRGLWRLPEPAHVSPQCASTISTASSWFSTAYSQPRMLARRKRSATSAPLRPEPLKSVAASVAGVAKMESSSRSAPMSAGSSTFSTSSS